MRLFVFHTLQLRKPEPLSSHFCLFRNPLCLTRKTALLSHSCECFYDTLFHRIDIRNQIQHFVGIAPLVVIPCDKLHEVVIEADAGARIKDGRSCVRDEVGGYDSVFGVADDALELFGFGSSLHSRFDSSKDRQPSSGSPSWRVPSSSGLP